MEVHSLFKNQDIDNGLKTILGRLFDIQHLKKCNQSFGSFHKCSM